MIAGTWLDPVVGIDIHWVLVPAPPAPPIPTPLPHPFVGIIYDPIGLAVGSAISAGISLATGAPITGPVLINNLPASNTGTEGTNRIVMPHFPTPPGIAWAPVPAGLKPPIPGRAPDPGVPAPVPTNDAVIVTGSKTVYVMGTNATRLGDLAMSCGEPVRLPSSTIIAVPKGPPVLIGGPPALDFMAAGFGAIRTSWVSGRLNALASRVFGQGSRAANWASKVICFFTGHPVDVSTGMVMVESTDFAIPGPIPLRFNRTYYSRSTYRGPLGTGWNHSYDQWIRIEAGTATYHDGDGREIYFREPTAGDAIFHRAERLTLSAPGMGFLIRRADGLALHFDAVDHDNVAQLTRIEDRNGHHIRLSHDARRRITQLRDTVGRRFDFEYDSRDLLTNITGPHPTIESRRIPIVSFEYDAHGDCTAAIDALGNARTYDYVNHLLVTETDRLGHSFHFAYDGCDADARCVRTWGDGGIWDHVLHYDVPAGRTVVEDSHGNSTIYEVHESGRIGAVIDATGARTAYSFNEWGEISATEQPDGTSTRQEYDARGSLTVIEHNSGARFDRHCDADGNLIRNQSSDAGAWHYSYDARGNLIRTVNPLGGEESLQYDRQGRLVQMRGGSGQSFVYNERHELVEWRSADGEVTRYQWNPWGRMSWREDGRGATEQREYDGKGRLVRRVRDNGSYIEYGYDAEDRVTHVRDSGGRTTEYTYSATGRITARQANGTLAAAYEYDVEDRLIGVGLSSGGRHELRYDAAGRLAGETTPAGVERQFRYSDARLGSIVEHAAPVPGSNGGRPSRTFRLGSGPTSSETVPPNDPPSSMEFDTADRPIHCRAGDIESEFAWDETGNLVRDARPPHEVSVRFSRHNELTAIDLPSGSRQTFQYDPNGKLREVRCDWHDGSISRLMLTYDDRGILAGFDAGAASMRQGVDRFGAVSWQEFRFANSERRRDYLYDAVGKLREIRDSRFGRCDIAYDRDGRPVHIDGFGRQPIIIDRGAGHGPIRVDASPMSALDGGRFVAGSNAVRESPDYGDVPIRMHHGQPLRLQHDDQHQLRTVLDPAGRTVARYDYDALGRRVRKTVSGHTRDFYWRGPQLVMEIEGDTRFEHVFAGWLPVLWWNGVQALTVFCDHRGQPLATADHSGHVTWEGIALPYAALDDSPARPPWASPNQYHDNETGLLYNFARYFDPSTLRFSTADPIGVFGGDDLYLGVPDPFSQFDLLGFEPASFSSRNTTQVRYDQHDFQEELDEAHRRGFTDKPSVRNVAVVELQDGTTKPFASGPKGHSEEAMIAWMKKEGIPPTAVKRIYSELSPCCEKCLGNLADFLGDHIKNVKLEFTWYHKNDGGRQAAKYDRMAKACSS